MSSLVFMFRHSKQQQINHGSHVEPNSFSRFQLELFVNAVRLIGELRVSLLTSTFGSKLSFGW